MKFQYIIEDGKLVNRNEHTMPTCENVLYEVLRVIDGQPLFCQEHLDRMEKSSALSGYRCLRTMGEMKNDIHLLIKEEGIHNCNIRIEMCFEKKDKGRTMVFFIDSSYPDDVMYKNGVATVFYNISRETPNIKRYNKVFKETIEAVKANTYFEVILVDEASNLSEGSRSNLFFVKDRTLITVKGEAVLMGITREKVLECARICDFEIVEKKITLAEATDFDGAFITGTSLGVLPLECIGGIKFDSSNETIASLKKAYDHMVRDDIDGGKYE